MVRPTSVSAIPARLRDPVEKALDAADSRSQSSGPVHPQNFAARLDAAHAVGCVGFRSVFIPSAVCAMQSYG